MELSLRLRRFRLKLCVHENRTRSVCWILYKLANMLQSLLQLIPYFFDYKTELFSFQNNPKDLDPSCKMDLDLWDCLGRVKLVLKRNFIGLI